jgi:protein phosphatase
MLRLQWGSASDVGRVRSNNQDARITTERVLAVADGMGGHRGGEVASQIALEVLPISFTEPSRDALVEAAHVANQVVWNRAAEDPELRGMGTTLVAIAPVVDDDGNETLAWLNIGDSRLYLLRDGELDQVSEDHSLVEEMVRDGRISADEARGHPQRNILTRALGIDQQPEVDSDFINPYAGDRYLLCSDGLFNEVDEQRIASTLRRLADPEQAAQELVRLALEGGGRDNITVVVADVVDDGGVSAAASAEIDEDTGEGHAEPSPAPIPADSPGPSDHAEEPGEKRPRPRLLTVRLAIFVVVLLAVIGGVAYAVIHQARAGYTVKRVDGAVLIYEGNGDNVLWLDPRVKETVGSITIAPADQQRVDAGQHFDSLSAAHDYIDTLRRNAASVGPAATTTTTTTTTSTTTTTTPSAPPAVN